MNGVYVENPGIWTLQGFTDYSYPGLFVPSWTVHTMDYSYHPWTFHTLDESYVGLFVPCTGWFYHVEN